MPPSEISPAELEARLRLHRLPDVGPRRYYSLFSAFGSASSALSAPASAWRALGLPEACPRPAPRRGAALKFARVPALHCAGLSAPDTMCCCMTRLLTRRC